MMRRSLRAVMIGVVIGGAIAISSLSSLPSSTASAASTGGFASKSAKAVAPSFDVVQTKISIDGNVWHAHWVVLGPDDACGKGSLKVLDIPEGAKPKVPKTWPGLPILLDSPGRSPRLEANAIEIRVPFDDISAVASASFDGVTAGLRVNQSVHSPLLCVVDVFKIASGDLSLPGKLGR